MNEYEYIAKTVYEQLEQSSPVVLISLLNLKGSTPRHEGSKMAVGSDGTAYGTIGGSLLEAMAVKKAREVIETGHSIIVTFDMTGENVANPDMICGGETEILLEYMEPTPENRRFAGLWYGNISRSSNCYLCTCLQRNGDNVTIPGRAIVSGNTIDGTLPESISLGNIKEELHDNPYGLGR